MTAAIIPNTALSHNLQDALRRCGTAKTIARVIQCSHRTVEDWLQGRREPRLQQTLRLMAAFDEFKAAILETIETETGHDVGDNGAIGGGISAGRAGMVEDKPVLYGRRRTNI